MVNSLLDSSALLAVIKREKGYKEIEKHLETSFISSVNYCEVITVLTRSKIPVSEAVDVVRPLIQKVIPFDEDIAIKAGELSYLTKQYGLSLGDKACIATGAYLDCNIITTDRIWSKLNLSVKISVAR